MSYYKYQAFMCINNRIDGTPCCQDHCAKEKRLYLKARCKELGIDGEGGVRINTAGCLDRCELGPVMVIYPEQVWYTYVDEEDLEEILQSHLINGKEVERLKIEN